MELSDSRGQAIGFDTEPGRIEVAGAPLVTVRGQVYLQGVRGYAGGVRVSLRDAANRELASGTSAWNGAYELAVEAAALTPGTHRVMAVKTPVYLSAAPPEFTVTEEVYEYEVPPVVLPPGDIDGNDEVALADFLCLARIYGRTFAWTDQENWSPAEDLNRDNRVSLFDLVLLARNYGKRGALVSH